MFCVGAVTTGSTATIARAPEIPLSGDTAAPLRELLLSCTHYTWELLSLNCDQVLSA